MSVFLLVAAAGDRHRKPRSHNLDSRRLRLQCGMYMSTQRNDLCCLYIALILLPARSNSSISQLTFTDAILFIYPLIFTVYPFCSMAWET